MKCLGKGLRELGQNYLQNICIFADTKAEWMIAAQVKTIFVKFLSLYFFEVLKVGYFYFVGERNLFFQIINTYTYRETYEVALLQKSSDLSLLVNDGFLIFL